MQTIELLAPAKNIECGIAAIDHGADAVLAAAGTAAGGSVRVPRSDRKKTEP